MLLREFLALQEVGDVRGELAVEVTGLAYDSRQVRKGYVFFAIAGGKLDGHDFVADAIERGAAAVVVEKKSTWPSHATWVRVQNVRRTMGLWAAHFFGNPSRHLTIAGITGTNGKTTVTYLVESILASAGMQPGVIGTINYRYRGKTFPSHHTTPESVELHRLLSEMNGAGVQSAVMEVSSHALVQERVRGIDFDAALFTNLSRDHLDYHTDLDDYFAAKTRLFADYLYTSAKTKAAAVIHAGDPRGLKLIAKMSKLGIESWTYGCEGDWDVRPLNIQTDINGSRGTLQAKEHVLEFSSALIGAVNLENILGAAALGFALNLPVSAIRQGIESLKSVPGRLERIHNSLDITILVDYAHTPDALEKVLQAIRPLARSRVLTVFGCGGDRDRGKRPLMGEIAARLSDVVFLTSDNPRTENPAAILSEVEAGVCRTGIPKLSIANSSGVAAKQASPTVQNETARGYYVQADRRSAIRDALGRARPGDVLLIAGKGHEDYQILGTEKIHFDDREVARAELSRMHALPEAEARP